MPFIFRIASPNTMLMEIAADSEEDLLEWMRMIRECTSMAEQKVTSLLNVRILRIDKIKCLHTIQPWYVVT